MKSKKKQNKSANMKKVLSPNKDPIPNGKVRKRKKIATYKLLKASWKYQGKLFFAESTLHGVRYIAETNRPLIERLMWFVCVLIGAISTMVIIVSLWEKFQTNPTITGLDTDFHNWDIPFPAVTICPNRPWNTEKVDAFVETIMDKDKNIDAVKAGKLVEVITTLTEMSLGNLNYFVNTTDFDALLENEDLKQLTYKIMVSCEDILDKCEWKNENYNCCSGFYPVYTETGFCYSFNSRHYEPIPVLATEEPYPEFELRYIKETDSKWALKFFLQNLNYSSDYNISVYIHNADEIPGIDLKPQHIWDFKVDRLLFSMRETYTTENANQLSIKQRHCIFDHEIKLKIDNIYTYTACTQECRMDNARRLCGCVPHFYKTVAEQSYKHCKLKELQCIAMNLKKIESVDKCECELGCSNTIYEVDKLNEIAVPEAGEEDVEEVKFKSLECEFTSWPMIKYKREVLFGWVDLLVSFGGIAGLFLGFSLLSGVELIYYFTIRTFCMLYKERDELTQMVVNPKLDEKPDYDLGMVPYFIKEPKVGQGKELINRHFKEDHSFKAKSVVMVKPMQPKFVMPPFGIDYTN